MKIKKGDQVQVIAGKDRGKKGSVIRVFPTLDKVLVEGVNIAKRHRKSKKDNEKGERVEMPVPIHVSNVLLVDPKDGKPSRIGYKIEGGEKVRVSKRSGETLK
ncbi:MAG: 50S ribosomal protein L24 [Candidatus Moraniibacteriota bacterium]